MSVRDLLMKDVRSVAELTVEVSQQFIEQNAIQQNNLLLFEGYIVTVVGTPRRTDLGYLLVLERGL